MSRPRRFVRQIDNYKKPPKKYTRESIEKLLKGYMKQDVNEIPIGTHVRYFVYDPTGVPLFRPGGLLIRKDAEYVQLKSKVPNLVWSVQKKVKVTKGDKEYIQNNIFYKKVDEQDKDKEIRKLKKQNKKLKKKLEESEFVLEEEEPKSKKKKKKKKSTKKKKRRKPKKKKRSIKE